MGTLAKTQILIVDDHPTNIKVLSDLLMAYGFEVLIAKDGENALQKLQRVSPDLILLDILMPGMDGFETCRRLKAQESTQDIPVIFMTALTDPVDKIMGLTLGAVDYVTKPLQHEEVIARINIHLKLRSLTQQLETQNGLLQDEIRSRALCQAAQQLSEEKFTKIFRANPSPMMMMTWEAGRFVEVNQSFCQLTGYAPEELLGHTITELGFWVDPADQDRAQAFLNGTGSWDRVELPIYRKTGEVLYLLSSAEIIQLGNIPHILATAQDITPRKQTEAALRKSEEQRRLALEFAHMGCWEWQVSTGNVEFNEISWHLLGLDPIPPSTYQTWRDRVHPEDIDQIEHRLNTAIEQHQDFEAEYRVIHPNGEVHWLFSKGRGIYDAAGQPLKLVGVNLDITDRKQAEFALRASEARLQLVIEANNDGIWEWHIPTNQAFRSRQWYDILGYAPHELTDSNTEWEERVHPDDRAALKVIEQAYLNQQTPHYAITYRIRRKDGTYGWMESRAIVQRDEQGQPIRMIGSCRDVTAIKQQAEELKQARDAAEAANRAKSTFLANMNHELRTPLTIILGCSELLANNATLTAPQKQFLASINRSVQHLLDLINNVLELAKVEAGAIVLDLTPVDLWRLLHNLEEMFYPLTTVKGLSFSLDRDATVPQFIQTDERKLNQILINLLSNAVKFTAMGSVTVRVSCRPNPPASTAMDTAHRLHPPDDAQASRAAAPLFSETKASLYVEVADTGAGIASEEIQRVFDAFVQTEVGRISHQGTGLGLAICHQFVQLLGGDITIQSTVGQGTTFAFTVPIREISAPPPQPEPRLTKALIRQILGSRRDRILVVEDTAETQLILVQLLTAIGFTVRAADNGAEAIALWADWRPKLILMDMRMPVIDGYAATQQIRAKERIHPSPERTIIIAVTANVFKSDRAAILAAGCDDILTKPFREQDLLTKIADRLGLQYLALPEPPQARTEPAVERPALKVTEAEEQILQLLKTMPTHWLADLDRAAMRLNANRCTQLITQIPPALSALSQLLTHLIANFRFDVITTLLSPYQNRGPDTNTSPPDNS
jgi:PAS domain S-box-containing protein